MRYLVTVGMALAAISLFAGAAPRQVAEPGMGEKTHNVLSNEPAAVAFLSRADLLAGVMRTRGGLADLEVSYTFNMRQPHPSQAYARYRETLAIRGDMLYREIEFGPPLETDPATYHRIVTWDGDRTTSQQTSIGQAIVTRGRTEDASTKGVPFFDLLMWNPPQNAGDARDHQSLQSLLQSPHASVRAHLETVGSSWCHVVDLPSPRGVRALSVWLDPSRGYLPVRQVFYRSGQPDEVLMEFGITNAMEVAPGAWLPVEGYKVLAPVAGHPATRTGNVWDFHVHWDGDVPAVRVDQGLEDEVFQLWKRLPPGFTAFDPATHEVWVVAGGDLERMSKAMVHVHVPPRVPRDSIDDTQASSRWHHWRNHFIVAGCGLLLVGGASRVVKSRYRGA